MKKRTRSNQEYDWMEGSRKRTRPTLSPSFLRKPYAGTSAETKDNTQTKLHEGGDDIGQTGI